MTDPVPEDTRPIHPGDPGAALMLLTRLPVPPSLAAHRGARAAWAWPLAGLAVGAIAAVVAFAALALGLSAGLAAGLALAATMLVTGGLHEDGLADCTDGFWGARERERRLEIMKDSRIGAYGVLAIIIVTGLRWLALASLFSFGSVWSALFIPALLSRGAMAFAMADLPFARGDGLAKAVGRPSRSVAGAGYGLAAVMAVLMTGMAAIPAIVSVALTALAVTRIAKAKIGGQTGDVLGATQQLSEVVALLTLVVVLN